MESRKRHPMKFGLIACCLLFLFISGDFVKASNLEQVSSPGVPTTQTVEYKISINRTPGCHRYRPQVAFNHRHNEYLVVWHNTCYPGFRTVYARRLDINGKPIGEPFFVSDLLSMDQVHPNVTYNGEDDVYMVVWMVDVSGNNSSYAIVGSTIPWNATHHGTSFSISIGTTSYTYWNPTVAWNSNRNKYLVIWDKYEDGNPPVIPWNIGFQHVGSDGTLGAKGNVASTNQPTKSDLVYNPGMDEFLVVWEQKAASTNQPAGTYGARFAWDATVSPPSFAIEPQYKDDHNPSVATNGQNRYWVAKDVLYWDFGEIREYNGIEGAILDGFGTIIGDFGYPDMFGHGDYINPDVAFNNTGDTLVVSDWSTTNKIGLHVYDYENPEIKFDISLYGWNKRQAAVVGGYKGYLIVYENRSTQPDSRQHIYATRYVREGTVSPLFYKLTVTKAGTAGGQVTSSPAGIDCGITCSVLLLDDSRITLMASPDEDSIFTGWSGACSGMVDCEITMDDDKNVTARFEEGIITHLPIIFR